MSIRLYDTGARRWDGDIRRVAGTPYDCVTQSEADAQVAAGWATLVPPPDSPDAVPPTAPLPALLDALVSSLGQTDAAVLSPAQAWSRGEVLPPSVGQVVDPQSGAISWPAGVRPLGS